MSHTLSAFVPEIQTAITMPSHGPTDPPPECKESQDFSTSYSEEPRHHEQEGHEPTLPIWEEFKRLSNTSSSKSSTYTRPISPKCCPALFPMSDERHSTFPAMPEFDLSTGNYFAIQNNFLGPPRTPSPTVLLPRIEYFSRPSGLTHPLPESFDKAKNITGGKLSVCSEQERKQMLENIGHRIKTAFQDNTDAFTKSTDPGNKLGAAFTYHFPKEATTMHNTKKCYCLKHFCYDICHTSADPSNHPESKSTTQPPQNGCAAPDRSTDSIKRPRIMRAEDDKEVKEREHIEYLQRMADRERKLLEKCKRIKEDSKKREDAEKKKKKAAREALKQEEEQMRQREKAEEQARRKHIKIENKRARRNAETEVSQMNIAELAISTANEDSPYASPVPEESPYSSLKEELENAKQADSWIPSTLESRPEVLKKDNASTSPNATKPLSNNVTRTRGFVRVQTPRQAVEEERWYSVAISDDDDDWEKVEGEVGAEWEWVGR